MKYDFSKCNNLRWELGDQKGFCRVFKDAAGDMRISFVHAQVLCLGLPEETFGKTFELDKLDSIRDNDKEFLSAVKFVPRAPETYKDWQVGDVVAIDEFDEIDLKVVVSARINDIVICSYIQESVVFGMFTCEELKTKGSLVLTDYERTLIHVPKYVFNQGDKVLARDTEEDSVWYAGKYYGMSEFNDVPYSVCIGWERKPYNFPECIPYNEKTWRLLGTTDDYNESDE